MRNMKTQCTSSSRQSNYADVRRSGFTFVELLVVFVIVVILVSLVLPALSEARKAARKTQCQNHLRNVSFALLWFEESENRFPASGYYYDPPSGAGGPHHSWAVSILPYLEQGSLFDKWDRERAITSVVNRPLTIGHIPTYICPIDITRSKDQEGDLSYAVNGGWGFTIRNTAGVGDCPLDWHGNLLDLNRDGNVCGVLKNLNDLDRDIFKRLGLFFLENWRAGGTERHHSIDHIIDGASQTYMVTENVRAGFDPNSSFAGFADPNPMRSAFYVGNPCEDPSCTTGAVNYQLCNASDSRINSGLWGAEGTSPVPNSFHVGGVNMAFCDGRVIFLSENIDGAVHAALASPQGMHLDGTALEQILVTGSEE